MVNAYKMTLTATDDSFTFSCPDVTRVIKCPTDKMDKIRDGFYYFDKATQTRHGLWRFVMVKKTTPTNSILAKRLWDALWDEGWRSE